LLALRRKILQASARYLQLAVEPTSDVTEFPQCFGRVQIGSLLVSRDDGNGDRDFRYLLMMIVTNREKGSRIAVFRPARIADRTIGHGVSTVFPIRSI